MAHIPSNRRKDIVKLDTHSIRTKALSDHRRAEQSLNQLKSQLKRYHEEDVPGFRTWMHRTFGTQLTEHRELIRAIEEKQNLLMEVADLAGRFAISEVEAYRKVLWRRAHPKEAEEEDRRLDEEENRLFEGSNRAGGEDDELGTDDLFEDGDFDIPENERESFSDFFESITGIRPPPGAFGKARPDSSRDDREIKALYRTVVRLLHPDCNSQMTESMKDLWHETQDAYARQDINALYSILARCESGDAGLGKHSPVSLIQRLTRQLKKAITSANREINTVRREPEWNYRNRTHEPGFANRIKFGLEELTRSLQLELDSLTSAVSELEWQANRPTRPARTRPAHRKPRKKRTQELNGQFDLPF